jgi:hypothetical protein
MCRGEKDPCLDYWSVTGKVCGDHGVHKMAPAAKSWQKFHETALYAEMKKGGVKYVYVQQKHKPNKHCEWSGLCKLKIASGWQGNHLIPVKDAKDQPFLVTFNDCLAFG